MLTTEKLQQLFDHCNRKYFDGTLPRPELKVSRAKTRLGQMACKRVPARMFALWSSKKPRYRDFSISISTYYNLTDEELEDVMIHEMIHYSIAYTGLRDTSAHGSIFRGMMENINRRFGRHITVSSHTKLQPRVKAAPRLRLALLVRLADGRHLLSVVNRSYAGELEERLRHLPDCLEHHWLQTTDESLARLPQVRSLRGKIITKEEYDQWVERCRCAIGNR